MLLFWILALTPLPPPAAPPCEVTLCMAGAFMRTDGANPRLARICGAAKTIAKDCSPDAKTCQPLFNFAAIGPAHQALFAALDTTKDGAIDAQDTPLRACVVGYSWGGVNAAEVARRFTNDPRVAPAQRRLHRLVLIDPFAPAVRSIPVPPGVRETTNYRHSKAPVRDCSARAPLGPYKGLPVQCPKGAVCLDHDLSKATATPQQTVAPAAVGHCSIIRAIEPQLRRVLGGP